MTVRVNKPSFNIREKLSELGRKFGLKGSEIAAAETVQDARNLISAGRRNLIINGDMRISQRGTSFTPTINEYNLDRWMFGGSHPNFTVSQGTSILPNGRSVNIFDVVCNANSIRWIDSYQGIEDIHIITGQTVTISAWVKTNHPSVNFRQYGQTNFGDTFIPDGEWHHYSVTTTLGALTLTKGSNINTAFFGIANSEISDWTAGQYIQFTHFQLELGKNATEFEHRSYGEELALCQRYFYKLDSGRVFTTANGTNSAISGVVLPVTMRDTPTPKFFGSNSTSGNIRMFSSGSGSQVNYDTAANSTATAGIPNGPGNFGFNFASFTPTFPAGYSGWMDLGTGVNNLKIEFDAEL